MIMRMVPALLILGLLGAKGDCFAELIAEMRFVNSTDSDLCVNLDEPSAEYCRVIKAHTTAGWNPECARTQPITVVLTVGHTGPVIYTRTAPCIEWEDADATFIIKQVGDEFVVTDSLPSELDTPASSRDSN